MIRLSIKQAMLDNTFYIGRICVCSSFDSYLAANIKQTPVSNIPSKTRGHCQWSLRFYTNKVRMNARAAERDTRLRNEGCVARGPSPDAGVRNPPSHLPRGPSPGWLSGWRNPFHVLPVTLGTSPWRRSRVRQLVDLRFRTMLFKSNSTNLRQ